MKNIIKISDQKKLNIYGKVPIYTVHLKFTNVNQFKKVLANDDYIEIYQPDDLKGRSIISGPESPTQRPSCIIETLIKPIVPLLIICIKDDWEFIQFLPGFLTFDSDMYSCDIESSYTSTPTELGLEAIEYWIMRKRGLIPQRFTKNLF